MCQSTSPRVDDAPGKPERQERQVQAAINIHNIRYAGITDDVPTLQRLLREACAGSRKLIARVIKARAQRDNAREEARQNCANIVLSMAHALRQQNRISAGYVQDSHATDAALARVEEFLGLPADGTQGERIERISRARRGILRKGLEHPLHYQEYQISPQEIQASVGYLVEATRRRLVEDFVAQGHTPRTIVVRVQDW